MSSIYDKASLVLIPSGTKTSKVYSQKPVSGDGDFTFSRSTAATRVNADGNIEKETQNLLLQSNSYNTTWSGFNGASGQAGYDGTNNAWRYDSDSSVLRLQQVGINFSGVHTFSFYAKYVDAQWFALQIAGTTNESAWFDIQNGTLGSTSSAVDSSITSVGGGWYRCSVTGSASNQNRVRLYVVGSDGSLSNITASLLIQDAQLEQGLVARDYIETTTTAVEGGITDNVPRLDYTDSSCPALLLEPQRTNKFPHSEFTDGYFSHNVTWTYNAAESPEGVDNALLSTYSGAGYFGDALPVTAGLTYTFSLYLKGDAGKSLRIYLDGNGSGGYFFTQEQILLDGTWTRYDKTYTIPAGASSVNLVVQNSSWGGHPSVTELYSYGLQFEEGSYATSYIPTYGSAVTRNSESCEITSGLNVIGQEQGTMYWDINFIDNGGYPAIFLYDGTSNNRLLIQRRGNNNVMQTQVRSLGSLQADYLTSSAISNGNHKMAVAYASNDFQSYLDGASAGSDSSGTTYTNQLTQVSLKPNEASIRINQVLVFKTRLTNQELADLTTL